MKNSRKEWEPVATAYCASCFIGDKMDAQSISNLITSVGFPIFACIAIFYMLNKEREDHKNEVNSLKNVIGEINETLSALKQLIQDKMK